MEYEYSKLWQNGLEQNTEQNIKQNCKHFLGLDQRLSNAKQPPPFIPLVEGDMR
jgi:hypothetical protein